MHAAFLRHGRFVCLLGLSGALLPLPALAQAGLSGDALSGQMEELRGKTPFNQGFKSKSALGQLEELTGTKVDRSSPAQAPAPRAAPQPSRSAQLRNQFNQEVAATVADALVQMIFSDDSAQKKAEAEAAAAAARAKAEAEAEAFWVQQELARWARIQKAQQDRLEWDDREAQIEDRLGDAFTVSTGTAFFGQPSGPDAATAALLSDVGDATAPIPPSGPDASAQDPSVVDLRNSSLTVPASISSTGAGPGGRAPVTATSWAYDLTDRTEAPPPASTQQLNALVAYFGPWLGKWYWETVIQGAAKSTAWGKVKNIPGMSYLNAVVGANEARVSGTEELGESATDLTEFAGSYASNAATILGNPYSDGSAFLNSTAGSVDDQVRKMKVKYAELIFHGFADRSEMVDLEKVRTPVGEGNFGPLYGRGAHPDEFRNTNVLFGRPTSH